ncbi:HNH endonuclease [Paenibacillus sp. FSL W8-1187]|uniref:HNH endonuclease family protein n=1 Tax=Paenibacillus pasadenensis TaxID=217090 RepID=A0A2N5NAJ8_9BACL|nr:HNH endonuclease signature motif containing protein [Paenibacillus pasadenensis]PLT47310.1 HNH endonuclease family protein [Paenibacillus pasadenensis]
MDTKQCAVCGRDKPEGAFPKRTGRKGRRGTCRACQRRRKRDEVGAEALLPPAAARRARGRAAVLAPGASAAAPTAGGGERAPGASVAAPAAGGGERASQSVAAPAAAAAERDPAAGKGAAAVAAARRTAPDPPAAASGREPSPDSPAAEARPSAGASGTAAARSPEAVVSSADAVSETGPSKRKRKRRRRRKGRKAAVAASHSHTPGVRLPYKPIRPFKGPFSYDPSVLNDRGTGLIQLRGRRESGKRWHTEIDRDIAVRMVQEGAAGILHPRLIHKLYTKSDFRLLILQRDNYVCHYCGRFGDTIDHVFPKSKGGLSTPDNCVCACSACNLKKADTLPDYL